MEVEVHVAYCALIVESQTSSKHYYYMTMATAWQGWLIHCCCDLLAAGCTLHMVDYHPCQQLRCCGVPISTTGGWCDFFLFFSAPENFSASLLIMLAWLVPEITSVAKVRTPNSLNFDARIIIYFLYFFRILLLSSLWTSGDHRVSSLLPPGSCLQLLSRIGFSNPTARLFFIECC